MSEKDFRPSRSVSPLRFLSSLFSAGIADGQPVPFDNLFEIDRFDLTIEYVKEFVGEWFDQNPLGQVSQASSFFLWIG
jgi:hypothetical protein